MFNRSKEQCVFCDTSMSGADRPLQPGAMRRVASGLMTARVLSDICKDHGAPTCSLAVVQLHLNCVGFTAIAPCVGNYPAVESLWLERNKILRVENLEALVELRCLGLNNNLIERVQGVEHMKHLTMLNLSGNRLARLAGLDALKSLRILLVADNQLRTRADVAHLEVGRCRLTPG